MSQPTVVNLNPDARRKTVLPPIVHTVRQLSKEQLVALMQKLFDSTDDAMFELADRSHTDTDQALFFESMRQIRLQRKRVIVDFIRLVSQNFEVAFGNEQAIAEDQDELELTDPEELALVEEDELELSVAITGIVSKVNGRCGYAIDHLTSRLDHVCTASTISDRDNPLGPHQLSKAYVSSLELLEVNIKIKIILMKLFERMVMERLEPLYDAANELMADAGVLKDITQRKPATPQNPTPPGSPGSIVQAAGDGPVEGAGDDQLGGHAGGHAGGQAHGRSSGMQAASHSRGVAAEFSALQDLLAGAQPALRAQATHHHSPGSVIPHEGVPDGLGGWKDIAAERHESYGDESKVALTTDQLLTLLTGLQKEAMTRPMDIAQAPQQVDVRREVMEHSVDVTGGDEAKVEKNADDVISLVGMLFDYILNDRNLAIPMKALISRLQIPVVKLAVIDPHFFNNVEHPARVLLNELSTAGIGWSTAAELRRDALYDKIEGIVLTVLNGSAETPELYVEQLADLREFLRRDTKRHAIVEQRVLEAESGKARMRVAKETVQQLINQKASGLRLPAGVGRFVGEYWSKVLVLSASKHGDTSKEWHRDVETLDDLLWSLQPLNNKEDLSKRRDLMPGLMVLLENGIAQVVSKDPEREELLANVRKELDAAVDNDEAFLDDEEESWQAPPPPEEYEALAEIRLTEVVTEPAEKIEVDAKHLQTIDSLQIGGWIEISEADKSPLRCKLTMVLQPGNRHVFVNRRGMKVADYSKEELALLAEQDALAMLDESEVFDRALQAVVGNLRKMQSTPVQID